MANDITVHRSFQPGELLVEVVSVGLYGLTAAEVPIAPIAGLNAGTVQGALEGITGLSRNKTIYVAGSGNDATGDGSQSKPFRSIQKALNAVPKALNGYTVTISLSAGSYEGFTITGYLSGEISIVGINTKGSVKIISKSTIYETAATIMLKYLTFSGSFDGDAVIHRNSKFLNLSNCWFNVAVANKRHLIYGLSSGGMFVYNAVIENCTAQAIILASTGSEIIIQGVSGAGNNGIGLYAAESTIRKSGYTMTATTAQLITGGGQILE